MLYVYLICVDDRAYHYLNPIFVIMGSLFPDSDHRHAPAGKLLPLWLVFRHRGFTHTIWGVILFALPIFTYSRACGISFVIGYLSHLLLDSITPSGVNWLGIKKPRQRAG